MSNEKETQTTSQVAALIARGKEQGYLTYAELNDHLPESITETEQIEDIIQMLNDLGIPVHERRSQPDLARRLHHHLPGKRHTRAGDRKSVV